VTPKEYKARYENIKVKRTNGTVETVRVRKYRLDGSTVNTAAMEAFRSTFFSRGIDTDLTIVTGSGEVKIQGSLTKTEKRFKKAGVEVKISVEGAGGEVAATSSSGIDWGAICVYSFLGKGAPEHCQVALQLADHWGLAPNGLQAYADSALGLDCNGFVGNYIWHGRKGNGWASGGYHDLRGPDSLISNFFVGASLVSRWEEINPANTYLLAKVNSGGQIIPGGQGPETAGHIMISEPGHRSPGHWDTYSPRLWVVESTGGAISPGLTEGWYECLEYDQKKKVFTLDRGPEIQASRREIRCKIALLV